MNTSHIHIFQGATCVEFGHQHRYQGVSSELQIFTGHTHKMSGHSTKDNGHIHSYEIVTGPGLEVPGGHIHPYQGITTKSRRHLHSLVGNTLTNQLLGGYIPIPRAGFTLEEARQIGERLGIDWKQSPFSAIQFKTGLEVELEHGWRNPVTNVTDDDPITTGKIALAHLNEFPDYYERLTKLEREAKVFWRK